MSEAENPNLLGGAHEVTAEDVRALAGASTPHFALQVRNGARRLIGRRRPTPRPPRRRAQDRRAEKPAETAATCAARWAPATTDEEAGAGRLARRSTRRPRSTSTAEDVPIDAGRTWDRRRVFAEPEGRELSMVA